MPNPQLEQDLRDAIAATGQAIMAIRHDHRQEAVTRVLTTQGWLPAAPLARDFLIGVFVAAHEQRGNLEAFSRVLDFINAQAALPADATGEGDRPALDAAAVKALREAMDPA